MKILFCSSCSEPICFPLKQHAHVKIVTVTDADLIHIELAIVNNLRNCDLISNCSQFLKWFTIASCKLHLSMLISVWLCCLSDIALILVMWHPFRNKILKPSVCRQISGSGFVLGWIKNQYFNAKYKTKLNKVCINSKTWKKIERKSQTELVQVFKEKSLLIKKKTIKFLNGGF